MGRKRSSNKKDLTLFVDKDILDKLKEWEINKSLLFTEAAKQLIEKREKEGKNKS